LAFVGTMTSPFTATGVEFTSSFSSLFVRLLQIVSPVLESRQCKKPLRTAFYFIPSVMTGSTACVFLYPNRVSLNEAFEVLEPDDGKLSRPVLRGPGPSNGVRLLDPRVLRRLLRPSLTEAPSLRRRYPASSVLRTSPLPHAARPVSRELSVDLDHDHRWGFPCCLWSPRRTCRRHYPGRFNGACSLVYLH
jgi:hypothetical protein